ncbi:MAG: bacteriohemerythrin [Thiohalomonadaceae bacterium]
MGIFHWDSAYCVGIDQVDGQHERLVAIVNRLDEAVSIGGEAAQINGILQELLDYTRYHFGTEERLMEAAPHLLAHFRRHKREHEDFVQKVLGFVGAMGRAEVADVARPLLDYLLQWLVAHILGSDREMARLLSNPQAAPDGDTATAQRALDVAAAERKLIAALSESEWRFRAIADNAPVLIWMSTAAGQRVFFNRPWCDFTGVDSGQLAARWRDLIHADDLPACEEAYRREPPAPVSLEYRLLRADGSWRWMLETAVPRQSEGSFAGYVGSCLDISERKAWEQTLEREVAERTAELRDANARLERDKAEQQRLIARLRDTQGQLLQSEKMASIGQLAAGVAHEINNPIGYVKSNLNTLARYVEDLLRIADAAAHDAAVQQACGDIDLAFIRADTAGLLAETREGIERVQQIVRDLKDFSHVDQAEWQVTDVHNGLESTLNLVWNELKYKATVVRDYGDLPPVPCLPRQLNQVFMNLLVNAAQAIERKGVITLRTRRRGDMAVIEISDTGAGIAQEHLGRIFEPFFTTKPVGKGTGLGLSIAYGIMEKHGGHIEVESAPGHGATFRLWLPLNPAAGGEAA